MRIAIVGASGLVGQATTDLMLARRVEVTPFVHSTGNSWQLLANGVVPRQLDVLDRKQVRPALIGHTHVINCTRGGEDVMLGGLNNLLEAATALKLARFVHLSSVAVYGDPPPPTAEEENGPTQAAPGSYGEIKLRQDRMVQRYAKRGLRATILCPPNIIGPNSPFLLSILSALDRGAFLVADSGATICNTVDADNLAHACWLALTAEVESGSRYFVTDDERVSWARVLTAVGAAGEVCVAAPQCTVDELRQMRRTPRPVRRSLLRAVLHLFSSDVREALRKDPLLASTDVTIRRWIARLGPRMEDRMRLAIEGPLRVAPAATRPNIEVALSSQQLRGVWHRCDRAKSELNYERLHSFEASMGAFSHWLRTIRGMDDEDWHLRRMLFRVA